MLEPSKNGRIKVFQVLVRYDEWADAQGLDPLNERIIAGELNTLFLREGIYYEGEGQDMVACGVQWKLKVIEDKRGQQAA